MNDIFRHMQEQMDPSPESVDELKEHLEKAPAKNRRQVWAFAAVAACAALVIAAYPVYRAARPAPVSPALHSYVLAEGTGNIQTAAAEEGPAVASGSDDMGARVEDAPAQPPLGNYSKDADASIHVGHGPSVPDGALVGEQTPVSEPVSRDVPVQEEGAAAYQGLMSYFTANYGYDAYPDWYGGAYVQGSILIVNVVAANVPSEYWMELDNDDRMVDKSFYLQVQDWAGSTAIGFSDVKYAYNNLRDLQDRVCALPELDGLGSWGCGVDEMGNCVTLGVPQADDALLAVLAVLDPADDAIRVETGFYISTIEETLPAITAQPLDGDPAGYGG